MVDLPNNDLYYRADIKNENSSRFKKATIFESCFEKKNNDKLFPQMLLNLL